MKCQYCGCTDEQACSGGCHWVADDVCSACVPKHVRYLIRMMSWNGHGFDINAKNAKTQKEVMGILSLTLREIRPVQITITDLKELPPEYQIGSVPAAWERLR